MFKYVWIFVILNVFLHLRGKMTSDLPNITRITFHASKFIHNRRFKFTGNWVFKTNEILNLYEEKTGLVSKSVHSRWVRDLNLRGVILEKWTQFQVNLNYKKTWYACPKILETKGSNKIVLKPPIYLSMNFGRRGLIVVNNNIQQLFLPVYGLLLFLPW